MNTHVLRLLGSSIGAALLLFSAPASAAANLLARVSAAGALISGSGVTGVSHPNIGIYEVTFTSNVSNCAFVATTANASGQALTVFTAGGHASANGVYVETKNQGGGLTDGPFELVVDCGTNGMKYAVVDYGGLFVRGTAGTTVTHLGIGRYNVTFTSAVKSCGYLATVGDPGNGLVFNPNGVYTGSGPTSYIVYIETKNPAGGLADGIPFHLAVICSNTRSRYAVVQDSGLIARGAALTSSYRASTGEYKVVMNRNVDPQCATVATRGSTNASVPFTPATVELVAGPAGNTRGIQVRDLLFFGGGLANQAFHAAVVCP